MMRQLARKLGLTRHAGVDHCSMSRRYGEDYCFQVNSHEPGFGHSCKPKAVTYGLAARDSACPPPQEALPWVTRYTANWDVLI